MVQGMSAKPALTVYDGGGFHNADLAASYSRILSDGSWKNNRIVLIIPAAATIPTKVAMSHWNLAFPPNQGVVRIAAEGMEVGNAYSAAIGNILADPNLSQWEFILTIEHDNTPPANGVLELVKRMQEHPEFACIGGLYWCKGPGGCTQIWGDIKDPIVNFRPQPPDPNGGLVECYGTGMGFNLWRMSMFRDSKLRKPWFETKDGCTQDLYFWTDARKHGYRCAIDCSIKVGHYDHEGKFGQPGMTW
jgi:hypothetical protein